MLHKQQFSSWLLLSGVVSVCASPGKIKLETFREQSLLPGAVFVASKANKQHESARTYESNTSRHYVISTLVNQPSYQTTSTPAPYQTATSATLPSNSYNAATPPVFLGSQCQADSYCATIPNSRCSNGICACKSLNVALGRLECLPPAVSFGDNCVVTAQCKGLDPLAACYVSCCHANCFICARVFFSRKWLQKLLRSRPTARSMHMRKHLLHCRLFMCVFQRKLLSARRNSRKSEDSMFEK